MVLIYLLVLVAFVIVGIMQTKEFRAIAREKLSGKWGKAVTLFLGYFLIALLLGFVSGLLGDESILSALLNLAVSIINVPLSYGLLTSFFKLYNDEEVGAFDFLSTGFSNFGRAWAISLRVFLKMLLPLVLYIVGILLMSGSLVFTSASIVNGSSAGTGALIFSILGIILMVISMIWLIIRSYTYEMASYIAIDSPELTTKEAVEKSKIIMPGNRAKLFWLEISFFGWAILTIFTIGIGCLWLAPYMQIANIAFYYFVAGKTENKATVEETSNEIENSTEA